MSKPPKRSHVADHQLARQLRLSARRLRELAAFTEDGLLADMRTLVNNLRREAELLDALTHAPEQEEEMPTLRPGQVQAPGLRMELSRPRHRRVSRT